MGSMFTTSNQSNDCETYGKQSCTDLGCAWCSFNESMKSNDSCVDPDYYCRDQLQTICQQLVFPFNASDCSVYMIDQKTIIIVVTIAILGCIAWCVNDMSKESESNTSSRWVRGIFQGVCVLICVAFGVVGIWYATDIHNNKLEEIYHILFICILFIPIAFISIIIVTICFLFIICRIVLFGMKPVHKYLLVALVIVIWLFFIGLFVLAAMELIPNHHWINVITFISLIILGIDIVDLVFHVQTEGSKHIFRSATTLPVLLRGNNDVKRQKLLDDAQMGDYAYDVDTILMDIDSDIDSGLDHLTMMPTYYKPSHSTGIYGSYTCPVFANEEIVKNAEEELKEFYIDCKCKDNLSESEEEQKYEILPEKSSVNFLPVKKNKLLRDAQKIHEHSSPKFLVGHLVLFVLYVGTFITLAFVDEEREPCYMNWATIGPVTISIWLWVRHHNTTLGCTIFALSLVIIMVILSIVSSVCIGDNCVWFHIIVIMIAFLWGLAILRTFLSTFGCIFSEIR
eukprot:132664_1